MDFLCFSVVMEVVSVVSCCSVRLAVDMDDLSKLSTAWCCTAQFVTMSRCALAPSSVVAIVKRSSTNIMAQIRAKMASMVGMPWGALFRLSSRLDVYRTKSIGDSTDPCLRPAGRV